MKKKIEYSGGIPQYKIVDPPEVSLEIDFANKNDGHDCFMDWEGCDLDAVPTYLRAALEKVEERIQRGGREKEGGEIKRKKSHQRVEDIHDVSRWSVVEPAEEDQEKMGRKMVVIKADKDTAYYLYDWTTNDLEANTKMTGGRPDQIKQMHDQHVMENIELIKNQAYSEKSLEEVIQKWKDKTVLICGSGPSLMRCVDEIPDSDEFVVIAINEAIPQIPDEKIDFAFATDRAPKPEWVKDTEGVDLICSPIVPKEYIEEFRTVGFFRYISAVDADDVLLQRFPDVYDSLIPVDVGKTATYSAMNLAYQSGTDRIVFFGQDFSATSGWYSVSTEMDWERFNNDRLNWYIKEDINGRLAPTCKRMDDSMRYVKGQAAFLGEAGITVINGSGRGILDLESSPNSTMAPEHNHNMHPAEAIDYCKQQKTIHIETSNNGHPKQLKGKHDGKRKSLRTV